MFLVHLKKKRREKNIGLDNLSIIHVPRLPDLFSFSFMVIFFSYSKNLGKAMQYWNSTNRDLFQNIPSSTQRPDAFIVYCSALYLSLSLLWPLAKQFKQALGSPKDRCENEVATTESSSDKYVSASFTFRRKQRRRIFKTKKKGR